MFWEAGPPKMKTTPQLKCHKKFRLQPNENNTNNLEDIENEDNPKNKDKPENEIDAKNDKNIKMKTPTTIKKTTEN